MDQHRRDLLAPALAAFDAQTASMGTGVRAGCKPLWALDEGTVLKVLDAAAAAGDAATANLAWRHLEVALLPQGASHGRECAALTERCQSMLLKHF